MRRRRYIKSVAHWVIMSFLLLFPIVMVAISGFSKEEDEIKINYRYDSNDVAKSSDLVEGNIYHFVIDDKSYDEIFNDGTNTILHIDVVGGLFDFNNAMYDGVFDYPNLNGEFSSHTILYFTNTEFDMEIAYQDDSAGYCLLYLGDLHDYSISLDVYGVVSFSTNLDFNFDNVLVEKCLDEFNVIDSISYVDKSLRSQINEWSNDFVNMPINTWYLALCNAMNFTLTTNSVMNIIYIYPLYVIWVYVFDLITDLILVVVKLGHNALEKLGGDND